MKIIGIVSEYNPFHLGHKYQIEKAKYNYKDAYVVAVMSGNFVQRGDVAIVDKYNRAEIAVKNGVDLVVELPFPYSCQNAEIFAYGAVRELKKINVSAISFGCENANLALLKDIAHIQLYDNDLYTPKLKDYISQGLSYPDAVNKTINSILKDKYNKNSNVELSPNNTLALEYIKSCDMLDFSVDFIPVKRHMANHNDIAINENFASATAIRSEILSGSIKKIKSTITSTTYTELKKYYLENKLYNSLDLYFDYIQYKAISLGKDNIRNIYDVSEGLENKIFDNCLKYKNLHDYILSIKSKRYTYSRIRRILLNMLLDITYQTIDKLKNYDNNYIKVLAFNDKGKDIIKHAKTNGTSIITKFSDYKRNDIDADNDLIFKLTSNSTNIFYLPFSNKQDYFNNEYYKNVIYVK